MPKNCVKVNKVQINYKRSFAINFRFQLKWFEFKITDTIIYFNL